MNGRAAKDMRRQAAKVAQRVMEPTVGVLGGAAERQGKLLLQHNEKLKEHAGTINLHASVLAGDFKTRLRWLLFGVPPSGKAEQPADAGKENA